MVILKNQPVILLAGSERFLKEETLTRIKSAFLDNQSRDFNFNVFYAGSASAEKVLECACTAPFLGRKRVVLVRQFEEFSASDKRFILAYSKNPHKHTLLILETSETKLRLGSLGEIAQYARVVFCQPLKGKQLYDWISSQVAASGKKIEEEAGRLLVENLGDNLANLANSLESLILYTGKKVIIEKSDVEKLSGRRDLTSDAFKLFDALVAKDKKKTLQILDSLLKDAASAAQILGALAYKVISEKNRTKGPLFKQRLKELQRADMDIKRGRRQGRLALEVLAVRFLSCF